MSSVPVRRPRVLLGVDHKWRDLPVYAYLARLLRSKHGMDVTVIRRTWERSYLSLIRPDIVVFEALGYAGTRDLARELHDLGVKVVILPTEGAPIDEPNKLQLAGKGFDYTMVDLFLAWNREIRDRIVEYGSLPPDKVEVVGCPRFDLYRQPVSRLVMTREEFGRKYRLQPGRPIVTFASGFVLAGMATRNQEFLKTDWAALQKDKTGVGWYDNPFAMAATEIRTRDLFVDAVRRLHGDRPDWNFILRPHPGEDQVFYREFVRKEFPGGRIRILPTEYIWNILRSSDVLVARASTTAVEAWLSGKATVEFELNKTDFSQNYSEEYSLASPRASTYEELRDRIQDCIEKRDPGGETLALRERIIRKYFDQVDGRCGERVARRLRRLADEVRPDPAREWALARRYSRELLRLGVRMAKSALKSPVARSLVGGREECDYMGRFDRFIYPQDITKWERIVQAAKLV